MARGCAWQGGACVVGGGHAWWGVCIAGGMCGGGRAWQILRDTVNERAVCILLECILVKDLFSLNVQETLSEMSEKLTNKDPSR